MKILIATRAFYPRLSPRSFRATELAIELARQGHNVTVCLPFEDFDYSDFMHTHAVVLKNIGSPPRDLQASANSGDTGVVSRAIALGRKAAGRIAKWLFEYPDVLLMPKLARALQNGERYDLVISIAAPFPIHWGMALALKRNPNLCRVWIADCGDPYMGEQTHGRKKAWWFGYVERWFCRRADYITVPVAEAIAGYYPEFHQKIRVIPQGVRFDALVADVKYVPNPVPTFAYAGTFYGKRTPRRFLEYLASKREPFRFVCYTRSPKTLLPFAAKLGERLEIRDYVPRDQLIRELSSMDFLINVENGTSVQKPSKLIDYALSGRPILSIHPEDVDEATIDQFLAGDYQGQYRVENVERFDIRNVARQFIALAGGVDPNMDQISEP